MSSSKSKTENQYSWSAPPPTQATTNLQNMVDAGGHQAQDAIRSAYARADQDLTHSYASPLGAYTTADVRDKSLRSQRRDLNQSMGIDLANASHHDADAQFNRQATVAGLTAPVHELQSQRQPFTAGDYAGMALNGAGAAFT